MSHDMESQNINQFGEDKSEIFFIHGKLNMAVKSQRGASKWAVIYISLHLRKRSGLGDIK